MALSKSFLKLLKARQTNKNGTQKRLKKATKRLFPLSSERKYTAQLFAYTLQIRKQITEKIIPMLGSWFRATTWDYPDPVDATLKNDDIIDDVLAQLLRVLEIIDLDLQQSEDFVIQQAESIGFEVNAFNKLQFEKSTKSVLAVDIFQDEPWLETQLELFANQNSQLIKNMTENELERVSGIVQRGLQEGSGLESVTDNIEKSFGITRRHARLIARDQTSKLNGSLTKLRDQELGIETYRWQTSGDERVRASHRALDGKLCKWNDPTVYYDEKSKKWVKRTGTMTKVHVSQDVNCRCQAVADFSDLLK